MRLKRFANYCLPKLSVLAVLSAGGAITAACDQATDAEGAGSSESKEKPEESAAAAQVSGGGAVGGNRQVLEFHNSATRDGLFIDKAFTRAAASKLRRDTKFSAKIAGPTYAQPLYFEGGPGGKDLVIVATEQNQVTAFSATDGAIVWRKTLASPASRANLPCGNISTLGVTGTPVIDLASRTLVVAAMTLDGGAAKHKIFALSLDDGATRAGWPVDLDSKISANGNSFTSRVQNQRGALTILNDTVYVPYGGHYGDCGNYHGWVVGVPLKNPAAPIAWSTRAKAGGLWSPGGVASDGKSLFVATGNTMSPAGGLFSAPTTWGDGEAVIRLPPNLKFSAQNADYAAAMNWQSLDRSDSDVGGSGPLLFNVVNGDPSALAMALGKDGNAYLLNATNLGGMGRFLSAKRVSNEQIITAPAAYTTPSGTFVAFKGTATGGAQSCVGRKLTALKVAPGSPPQVSVSWCAGPAGQGSPIVTSTGNNAETIVWYVAAEGDNKLRGFNGETGAVVFDGGGAGDAMARVTRFQSPIVAKGRIFVAGNSDVYAFAVEGTAGGAVVPPTPPVGGIPVDPAAQACTEGYRTFGEAFLKSYCTTCHGAGVQLAGQRFDSLEAATSASSNISAIAGNTNGPNRMPPATSKQPTAAERQKLQAWLDSCN